MCSPAHLAAIRTFQSNRPNVQIFFINPTGGSYNPGFLPGLPYPGIDSPADAGRVASSLGLNLAGITPNEYNEVAVINASGQRSNLLTNDRNFLPSASAAAGGGGRVRT
jgi:hypothetical protein